MIQNPELELNDLLENQFDVKFAEHLSDIRMQGLPPDEEYCRAILLLLMLLFDQHYHYVDEEGTEEEHAIIDVAMHAIVGIAVLYSKRTDVVVRDVMHLMENTARTQPMFESRIQRHDGHLQ